MRLQIISDLHIDVGSGNVPGAVAGIDALIVAGDVCEGIEWAFAALRRTIPTDVPIVMVAGNHEFYGHVLEPERALGRQRAADYGITFLDDDVAILNGCRILGGTLWTDYALEGAGTRGLAMRAVERRLMDYRAISADEHGQRAAFTPDVALALHIATVKFLRRAMAEPFDGPTVVVTHHCPHPASIHARYAGDPANPGFCSDLTPLIEAGRPALWVHGHTHSSFDYQVGATRIVCNPHGYGRENTAYDPHLVVTI